MVYKLFTVTTVLLATAFAAAQNTGPNSRPRASDLGLKVGILPTGCGAVSPCFFPVR